MVPSTRSPASAMPALPVGLIVSLPIPDLLSSLPGVILLTDFVVVSDNRFALGPSAVGFYHWSIKFYKFSNWFNLLMVQKVLVKKKSTRKKALTRRFIL